MQQHVGQMVNPRLQAEQLAYSMCNIQVSGCQFEYSSAGRRGVIQDLEAGKTGPPPPGRAGMRLDLCQPLVLQTFLGDNPSDRTIATGRESHPSPQQHVNQ